MKESITMLIEIILWSIMYYIITGHFTIEDFKFICLWIGILDISDKLNDIGGKLK